MEKRRPGRPRKYATDADRASAARASQRERVEGWRSGLHSVLRTTTLEEAKEKAAAALGCKRSDL